MADLEQVDIRLAVTDDMAGYEPVKLRCRFAGHTDPNASMCVYPGHIHCYGCGGHIGRRMEALAFLLGLKSWKDAIVHAPKYIPATLDNYREQAADSARKDPLPRTIAAVYHNMLQSHRGHRVEWMHERGLSDATLSQALLGHDGTRFTIPIVCHKRRDDGTLDPSAPAQLVNIRYRTDPFYGEEDWQGNPLPKYSGMKGRNGLFIYPETFLAGDSRDHVILCEGELDALRLWQEGAPAISATNGVGNMHKVPGLLAPYTRLTHLYVASDMDRAGNIGWVEVLAATKHKECLDLARAMVEAARVLASGGGVEERRALKEAELWSEKVKTMLDHAEREIPVQRLTWPAAEGKDITEFLANKHTLDEAGYGGR